MSTQKFYRKLQKLLTWIPKNLWLVYTYRHLRSQSKLIYALTPPPNLKNVGDQAQAIAIHRWLRKHFPDIPVLEMDKDQSRDLLLGLKWLVQPKDLIVLHSGGNLGDRSRRSEKARRLIISSFPKNKIVSLPQTIFFSDTPTGTKEREATRNLYANHPNLTIIGRDPQSRELAADLFPKAQIFCMPDFVLSMPKKTNYIKNQSPQVLLCLRLDDESALSPRQRKEIANHLPYQCSYFDTTLARPIESYQREAVLENTLTLFNSSDVVVTDRYHGLIFAILCQKPCAVLSTVDHKLTSAMYWFRDMSHIKLVDKLDEIPSAVENLLKVEDRVSPDWNTQYFDKIPELVGLKSSVHNS